MAEVDAALDTETKEDVVEEEEQGTAINLSVHRYVAACHRSR